MTSLGDDVSMTKNPQTIFSCIKETSDKCASGEGVSKSTDKFSVSGRNSVTLTPWVQVFQFHACPGFNEQRRGENGLGNVDKKSNEEAKNLVLRVTWVRGRGSTDKCSLEDGISSDVSCGKQDVWLGKGVLWSRIF